MRSKAASTGFALALAAAAMLAVFGCGGDSATETASVPGSASSSSSSSGPEGAKEKAPSGQQGSEGPAPTQGEGGGSGEGSARPSAGKQGPTITAPKGPQERAPTPKERAEATVVSMSLESPDLKAGPESVSLLPAPYTCDGKDTWPALKWSGVPAGTAELAITVLNIEPVDEALFFDWAVSGLDPSLTGLESGQLPAGAVVGRNSFGKTGYSICPAKSPETVIFALYALPERLKARNGFDPAALRKEILAMSGNAGLLAVSYTRD